MARYDTKFLSALDEIETFAKSECSLSELRAASKIKGGLCTKFNDAKKIINKLLPFIKLIPVYGKPIVTAIKTLINIGDELCKP